LTKIVGIGLNKTGTKTLGEAMISLGLRHKTYSGSAFDCFQREDIEGVRQIMESFDSFEDWPWPLLFREIDHWYPEARFVLTVRKSPQVWFRSLCNMAVRRGPLDRYEKYIYGYAMPQGHRRELVQFYEQHNRAVEAHFADRPGKLIRICWEDGDGLERLASFLGVAFPPSTETHANRSSTWVYSGDSLPLAHLNRIVYQAVGRTRTELGRAKKRFTSRA